MDEINQLTEEVTDLHKENQTLQGLYNQQDQFLGKKNRNIYSI